MAENLEEKDYQGVAEIEYSPKGDVASLKEVAEELGLPVEVARKSLKVHEGQRALGNHLVKDEVIQSLRNVDLSERRLSEVRVEYGDFVVKLLLHLGYSLSWKGLFDAEVFRKAKYSEG